MKKVFLKLLHLFTCKNGISSPKQPSSVEENRQVGEKWSEVVSEKPKASLHHNFLSKEECEHLINLAKQTTDIFDLNTSWRIITALVRGSDDILNDIEKRISDITSIPQENGPGLRIIRYQVGQDYPPHCDENGDNNPCRATFIIYLSDVEKGGETYFPKAKGVAEKYKNVGRKCGLSIFGRKRGLFIKPKMGDALLLWNLNSDNTLDLSSLHGACPVKMGEKWLCTTLLYLSKYKPYGRRYLENFVDPR